MGKLAYRVESPEEEEGAEIVFASSEAVARVLGQNLLGAFFEEDEYSVTLAPEFQMWESLGFVPLRGLLNEGWYVFSAHHQFRIVESCTEEELKNYHQQALEEDWELGNHGLYIDSLLVESKDRKSLYRDMLEVEEHAYFIKEFKDSFVAFKEYVLKAYPDFNFTEWSGDYPSYTKTAKFTFPGAKYSTNEVRWQSHEDPMENIGVWVCNGDLEAFNAWREVQNASKG